METIMLWITLSYLALILLLYLYMQIQSNGGKENIFVSFHAMEANNDNVFCILEYENAIEKQKEENIIDDDKEVTIFIDSSNISSYNFKHSIIFE